MHTNRKAIFATLGAVTASLVLPLAAPLAAHADPPSWAPAHGWRAKHGDREDDQGERREHHRHHSSDYRRSYNGDGYRRVYDEARSSAAAQHRQQTKNTWRNVGLAGGAAAAAGVLTHNKNLTIGGAATALYSAYRYEQDRKNQARGNN